MKKLLILSLSLFSLLQAVIDSKTGLPNIYSFIKAVKEDNVAEATRLLAEGANPNARDSDYKPALHLAAENGSLEMVDVLLSHCGEIDKELGVSPRSCTALSIAFDRNNIPLMKQLLAWGANPSTVLSTAIANKSPEVVKLLLDAGASPYHHLKAAISSGDDKIAELVWSDGKPQLDSIYDALKAAIRIKSLPWVSRLLEKANLKELTNYSPSFHWNYSCPTTDLFILAIVIQAPEIAELILSQNIAVNITNVCTGAQPLHYIAEQGYITLAKTLISKGSDINAQRVYHVTGRYYSYYIGDRKTALHIACENNDPEMVAFLLEQGADVNIPNENNYLPFNYVPTDNKISQLLIDKGTDLNKALIGAAKKGELSQASLLLSLGAEVNYQNSSPLYDAAEHGHNDVVKLLLENGATTPTITITNVDGTFIDKDGTYAEDIFLSRAIRDRNYDVITTLLASGITPNTASILATVALNRLWLLKILVDHGASIPSAHLSIASYLDYHPEEYEAVFIFLIEQGMDANTKQHTNTILHTCAKHGLNKLASILVAHGADATLKNWEGRTPLMIAAEQKNKELVALLKPKSY